MYVTTLLWIFIMKNDIDNSRYSRVSQKIELDLINSDKFIKLKLLQNQYERIHFIGIGGIGMGGLALIFHKLGFIVTGSDLTSNNITEYLSSLSININIGPHKAENLDQLTSKSLIVITSTVKDSNLEYNSAKDRDLEIIRRAALLAKVLDCGIGIAITGTHGKTTTTSIVTNIFQKAKLDPTYAVGGILAATDLNADLGIGDYCIIEADESDATLKYYKPKILVINNIDADHLANYDNDINKLEAYIIDSLADESIIILNLDDDIIKNKIIDNIKNKNIVTFGSSQDVDYQLVSFEQKGHEVTFEVLIKNKNKVVLTLPMPGRHNAMNAVAAFCVADTQGIDIDIIKQGVAEFSGVGRRFQSYGEINIDNKKVTLIDDYGHHPKEVKATIDAIKSGWPERRLVLAYQPHKYSRTKDLFNDFVEVLSKADKLLLLPVYSAGEDLIPGGDSQSLYNALLKYNNNLDISYIEYDDFLLKIKDYVLDNDILVLQGAGSIGTLSKQVVQH